MSPVRIGVALAAFVTLGVVLVYAILDPMAATCDQARELDPRKVCPRYVDLALSLILIISGVITLFGILALPSATNTDGSYREQRIRFAIAMTVLVVYLIYFGMAVFWGKAGMNEMFTTLTDLLMIVIPFYFGASAAVEWSKKGSGAGTD